MMFFHKCYVAMVAFFNMCKYLSRASDKIAAIRIEVVTHNDINELEKVMEDRVANLDVSKHNGEDDDDSDIEPHDGFIH